MQTPNERNPVSPTNLLALSAAATATEHAVDECIQVLEDAGEAQAAHLLRRTFSRWPAGHVCSFVNDECLCGASR